MTISAVPLSTTEKKHMTASGMLNHFLLKAEIIIFLIT